VIKTHKPNKDRQLV